MAQFDAKDRRSFVSRTRKFRFIPSRSRPWLEGLEERVMMASNAITVENQLPGTSPQNWAVSGAGDTSIQGFAVDISVDQGQTASFKINDQSLAPYRVDIYRMGYYAGLGARLVATIPSTETLRQAQPAPLRNSSTGLVDAGNWAVSASWAVPLDATSGIYFARMTRQDTGGASLAYFVVRDDDGHSDLLFQTSDSTWQAYNTWGGNSLYQAADPLPAGRAFAVSYNRPLIVDASSGGLGDYNSPLHAEIPMVRWLESNGYDVSYSTDVDTDRNGSLLLTHKTFMSVGHDEYWSGGQRSNVEAARDAGVNLAFFSGNECFWKTRWETSIDGSGTPYRTLVCYKDSKNDSPLDPLYASPDRIWTGTWRDNRYSPPGDGGKPENALSGTMYMNDRASDGLGISMQVPAEDGKLRFWRNTSVANLAPGQVATLGQYVVGYEVDEDLDNGYRPAGLFDLSSTSFSTPSHVLVPWGTVVGPGTSTHSSTLYRAASGALVFGAGTIQWSWGLDGNNNNVPVTPDPSMQQATVNLLADMGSQPATIQPGLVPATASTDHTPPTSTITSPAAGTSLPTGTPVTILGTATDSGGGLVAGVEVSVDGGLTWHPASGRSSWSYTWTPNQNGTVSILSRAVDDSANLGPASAVVSVLAQGPISIFGSTTPGVISTADPNPIEVGVKFRSDINGSILGLRFYKATDNTGTHVGSLWSSTGTLLARATFVNESASGWQEVRFASPVTIQANTTYIASYHTNSGHYSSDDRFFSTNGASNGPLHALADGVDGPNGLYSYSSTSVFPSNSYRSENYYIDIKLDQNSVDSVAPTIVSRSPSADATGVSLTTVVKAGFSEAVSSTSINFTLTGPSGLVASTLSYDTATKISQLTPSSPLSPSTTYTVSVGGATDSSGNVMVPTSWSFTTSSDSSSTEISIWGDSVLPAVASFADNQPYELGVKFRSSIDGLITAIRYYKGAANTGTHVGNLWDAAGTLLATATFASESATGWQQVNFAAPVPITANTTYVASYHTNTGGYAVNSGYFANFSPTNGPLVALADGVQGGNGLFSPGASAFPNQSFNSNNYWVDVVFLDQAPVQAATATALTSSANPSNFGQSVTFTATVTVTSAAGTPAGTVAFYDGANLLGSATLNAAGIATFATSTLDAAAHSITASYAGSANLAASTSAILTQVVNPVVNQAPTATALASSANPSNFGQSVTFTATVTSAAGTPTGTVTFREGSTTLGSATINASGIATFSTSTLAAGSHSITASYAGTSNFAASTSAVLTQVVNQAGSTGISIWGNSVLPAVASFADPNPYELGVKFRSSIDGLITAIRYYKGAANTGTHVGNLWDAAGTLLATATFASESATGWQQVNFAAPVPITANTTYVASYHTNSGGYAVDAGYFANFSPTNGPLVALANGVQGGNGVFSPGASAFPTQTYNSNNYWVDVVFLDQAPVQAATATALASSANPSNFGQSVTFTATVTSAAGTPAGTVAFYDGANLLGSATLNAAGIATFATSTLDATAHSITAAYAGSANLAASTSAILTQVVNPVVNQAPTATALASSANPSNFGQSVTFTATVTSNAGTPAGMVGFYDGTNLLGTVALNASGIATFSTSTLDALAAGSHSITASYAGSANLAASTSAVLAQVVNQAATATALASSANPSNFGQSVTFTATVTSAAGTPAGTVTFREGSTTLGSATINASGIATFSTSTLAAGSHSITASYAGTSNFAASTSAVLAQVVNQAATATALASSANPSNFGQSVTFTATVTSAAGTPAGTVAFYDGANLLGSATLNAAGIATFATSTLDATAHSITAAYAGSANLAASTSAILTQVVNPVVNQAPTATALASSANPSNFGQSVTFTATVTSNAGTPAGMVGFYDGANLLGTVALNASGIATFSTSTLDALAAAAHSITAAYAGSANFAASTSAVLAQVVKQAATATALASSANPSNFGQSVTFTATVTSAAGTPTGTVTFREGSTTLGSATINASGIATFSTSTLAAGSHSIIAVYSGTANLASSSSPSLSQTVNQVVEQVATTTSLTVSPLTSVAGQLVTMSATVATTATGTPTGTVTFLDGTATIGTATINSSGVATFSISSLGVGSHSIKATYAGDSSFAASSSTARSQTVNKASTTTALISSGTPSVFGQAVTFTATIAVVAPGAGTPTGTVTFLDGTATIGTATINSSGVATFSISSLGVGSHSIKATYAGDSSFAARTSANRSQTVKKAATTTDLASSGSPSVFGQAVTFTATIAVVAPGAGTPTGTVTFTDGTTTIGTATLDASGVATFTISSLGVGNHQIRAKYAGDSSFAASTSARLTQRVNTAPATASLQISSPLVTASGTQAVPASNVAPSGDVPQVDVAGSSITAAAPPASLDQPTLVMSDQGPSAMTDVFDAALAQIQVDPYGPTVDLLLLDGPATKSKSRTMPQ